MKQTNKAKLFACIFSVFLITMLIVPQIAFSQEVEDISIGPINWAFAIMLKGQTKTYTVSSDFFPDVMIVGLIVKGSGNLSVSVTKTDTSGELIGVIQRGALSTVTDQEPQRFAHALGITPCTISVSGRFYEYGYGIIMSSLLASLEKGPHTYTLTVSFN